MCRESISKVFTVKESARPLRRICIPRRRGITRAPQSIAAAITSGARVPAAPLPGRAAGESRAPLVENVTQSLCNIAYITNPPFTPITCPVIKSLSGDARNETAFATSSGVPSRQSGVSSLRASIVSAECCLFISV